MKKSLILTLIISGMLIFSCDLFDPGNNETPPNMSIDNDSIPEWYPSHVIYSSDNTQDFNIVLDSFKTSYGLNSLMGLSVDPLLSRISKLHSCAIQVCDFSESGDTLEMCRNTMNEFASDWWRLLCMEKFEIDSMRVSLRGQFYPQSHYETPIYRPLPYLGAVSFYVNTDGTLDYIISTLIPQLPVPKNPLLNVDSAINILENYTFTINRYPNLVEYSLDPDDTTSTQLEVYIPKTYDTDSETFTNITYRLVWRISIHDGDLMVDALTGEILGFIQLTLYG